MTDRFHGPEPRALPRLPPRRLDRRLLQGSSVPPALPSLTRRRYLFGVSQAEPTGVLCHFRLEVELLREAKNELKSYKGVLCRFSNSQTPSGDLCCREQVDALFVFYYLFIDYFVERGKEREGNADAREKRLSVAPSRAPACS